MTDCITDYIRFCDDTTMPARTVHCFSNNKPWITSDLKALLNKKKKAFRSGDSEEQRRVQHELREMLRTCKDNYRRKLEAKLQQTSVRDVWAGMKHITGMKGKDRQTSGSLDRANQYNQFFNSILLYNTSPSAPPSSPPTPSSSSTDDICNNPCPTVTTGQVKRQMERLHQRKAAGPDGISPRILKTCHVKTPSADLLFPVDRIRVYDSAETREDTLFIKAWSPYCSVRVTAFLRTHNEK
ncbi:hypothetical protein N1851_012366 [Merluccius polli]|uniref:Reverse transcriptase n=1 Tax=Merluccius polli TaxID=89951 RepID=A0AA47P4D9_MERPO|nr:hypothetical protein N1851_012366 [Merluccius polli]